MNRRARARRSPFRVPASRRSILLALALVLAGPGSCAHPASVAAAFDGKRAFSLLERQCAFGPRVPGTAAHDSCFAFLVASLREQAPVVEVDSFRYDSPDLRHEVRLMNVLARFRPDQKTRILFGAHWDSRPWADAEREPAARRHPILGANDGASGVAVLLELARQLRKNPPALGVDLVLFDGEDLGTQTNPSGFFQGSSRYVEWKRDDRPLFMVLLDMVGKRNAVFYREANSNDQASNIVDVVWGEARELAIPNFRSETKYRVFDDHTPFLNAGIPAIDIIDFAFPEWHTLRDTPAVCDPASLEAVGRVLLSLSVRATFLSR